MKEDVFGKKYYDNLGREYIVSDFEFTLPPNYTFETPPIEKRGFVIRLINNNWQYVPDYTGKIVYNKKTKEPFEVKEIGELDEQYTEKEPPTQFHEWVDNEWVLSVEKEKELNQQVQHDLINSIDETAAQITMRWTRFTVEYEAREQAAKSFIGSGYKDEPNIYITSFSDAAKMDVKKAAQLIMKQAEGLRQLQEQLAVQRMRKYELKADGLSVEQMQSIHDDIINKMQKLAEAQQ
ncbi:hypothetical protein HPC38_00935 [Pasteurellaceae bacterium HPA106]|uniref:hypothetical protein n=1 Tax=Spirabiliibacterium pneumoniae TaxID=221400 RepID=UPI001AACB055|nr:hypothetical protein [Spirabiliibacterium pneumoniae]MBE2895445.1 hypothetical protein [Spirabiliibacterium pneumoniae]